MASGGLFRAVEAQYESLSGRDRKLLAGLLVFGSLLFVGVLLFTLNGWLSGQAEGIQQKKAKVELLRAYSDEYAVAATILQNAEERLKQYEGQSVSAFLEKTATTSNVREDLSVTKKTAETKDGVEQTRYTIELRRVSLEEALNFVYDVETSGYPLAVEQARFRTNPPVDGVKPVTVTVEAVHYRILEG